MAEKKRFRYVLFSHLIFFQTLPIFFKTLAGPQLTLWPPYFLFKTLARPELTPASSKASVCFPRGEWGD